MPGGYQNRNRRVGESGDSRRATCEYDDTCTRSCGSLYLHTRMSFPRRASRQKHNYVRVQNFARKLPYALLAWHQRQLHAALDPRCEMPGEGTIEGWLE